MEELSVFIKNKLNAKLVVKTNPIYVFVGIEQYINMDLFSKYLVDESTFARNGNSDLFSPQWFTKVFTKLTLNTDNEDYHILSFAQFSYILEYIQPDFFKERIVLVSDGFRTLLPLDQNDYLEKATDENIEERDDSMPLYMAEQFQVGDDYYYSINKPAEEFYHLDLFKEHQPLQLLENDSSIEVINLANDPNELDYFINTCIKEHNFNKRRIVKVFKKQPINDQWKDILERVNWLLIQFGGQLYELDEKGISQDYSPTEEITTLLKRYWGEGTNFRNINVYKNPDLGKDIISVSQGLIVETIIDEYKKAKSGKKFKDLFMTAPTGAGKSLIFQLPAFYVSEHNEVTIVVSPLIALMKDQVEQIKNNRGFQKVRFLNSDLSLIERDRVIEGCKNGDVDILYLSPELLLSYDISFFIGTERKLGLLVIDEAHLITTWGRDFRVDYWFLGQHVNKIRKISECKFPIVAVTATAVYGGDNDMVFDSIKSLYMHNPHLFIGEVKRKNISFVIDTHDPYRSNYDSEKEKETAQFISKIKEHGIKTIVYAPYRRHINKIIELLDGNGRNGTVVKYYSDMPSETKDSAYNAFKNNNATVMVSTKAFGMGVDIPDIQLVYHHAPSGLLPDYIQEIGRAARNPDINGFAALSYAVEDQRYSKVLHGISALHHFQLRDVLKKIYNIFLAGGKRRNMLISVQDFEYIFDNAKDYDQKVMTSLMMIEKDYLAKFRFNVLIARPKKLFVKVFSRVNNIGLNMLQRKHFGCYRVIETTNNNYSIVELDLGNIWTRSFSDRSFPIIKRKFYNEELFREEEGVECKPLIKFTFSLNVDSNNVTNSLINIINVFINSLNLLRNRFFSAEEFKSSLNLQDNDLKEKLAKFILYSFSKTGNNQYQIGNSFLQCRRNTNQEEEYRIIDNGYLNVFASIIRLANQILTNDNIVKFASRDSIYSQNYTYLGELIDLLGVGTYESRGGDSLMIFIRINDPIRVRKDSRDINYRNSLLSNIENRYKSSSDIFDHFFMHSFENEERWNLIEDFFLGESSNEILAKYPGVERNNVDIVNYVVNHTNAKPITVTENQYFLPKENTFLKSDDLITVNKRTDSVSVWINKDPVEFDKTIRKYNITIQKENYARLMSKLRKYHFSYYRDLVGLNIAIDFPGYDKPIIANIPYNNEPVKFYNWWRKNEDKVTMSNIEIRKLLLKVNEMDSNALIKKHKKMLL